MGKRKKGKKQPRQVIVLKQPAQPAPHAIPLQKNKPTWKRIPGWLYGALTLVGLLVGLRVLYPSLSINDDYAFDAMFPYNTSFSIINEGFWPMSDISAVCSADFTMLPWTADPSDKSSMGLHTEDGNHTDFSRRLRYKQRVTLPCNHNVVANGHRIAPGARLRITVTYQLAGTRIHRSQVFNFRTVMGWGGQSYWQYDD